MIFLLGFDEQDISGVEIVVLNAVAVHLCDGPGGGGEVVKQMVGVGKWIGPDDLFKGGVAIDRFCQEKTDAMAVFIFSDCPGDRLRDGERAFVGDVEFIEFLLCRARGEEGFESGADGIGTVEFDVIGLGVVREEADFINRSDWVLFDERGVWVVFEITEVGGV